MASKSDTFPLGHKPQEEAIIRSSLDLGAAVRRQRKQLAFKQLDIAGLGNTGNRFIVELEQGKPTLQLQKVLDVLDLLGLEMMVRPRAGRAP